MAESRALPAGFGELEVLAVGTFLLVEALCGLSLNGLTIFSFCKTPELRAPSHLLVLSLALADSGISLNTLVTAISSLLWHWPYGSEGCQVHGFQGFATALASICGSAAIAWGATSTTVHMTAELHLHVEESKMVSFMSPPVTVRTVGCTAAWENHTSLTQELPLHDQLSLKDPPSNAMPRALVPEFLENILQANILLLSNQLAWNTAIPLVLFVWLSSAFWAALPLMGWGHYDYEPLRTCCSLDYSRGDRNFISFLFTVAFFNFLVPLFITFTSYRLMEEKFARNGHLQVNTTLPGRMLLLGWGPYALLYLYAAIADVSSISPKLQMVPALIAKIMPTINAINYALHSGMVYRGIFQCLSPQKSKQN